MSLTVALSGKSNVLSANFFPFIDLSDDDYEIGLLSFETYNTIPNIIKNECDMFYFGNQKIQIPEGSYDIESISTYLEENIQENDGIVLRGNNNTLKTELRSTQKVYFNAPDKPNSIGPLLGFNKPNTVLEPKPGYHVSDDIVEIMKVNVISIHCNIATGSYLNGEPNHIIHQFFPTVDPGYKIVESPSPVIYHPINVRTIENLTLRILDQNGKLINFRGETITARLHIRKYGN